MRASPRTGERGGRGWGHLRDGVGVVVWLALVLGVGGLASRPGRVTAAAEGGWPRYTLEADQWWLLNLPGGRRLDASGLARLPGGDFLTVNDQFPAVYRLQFPPAGGTNAVDLEPLPGLFTPEQLARVSGGGRLRLDCEGLAVDARGRLYIAEESRRLVLRWDPETSRLERLEIDWSPVRSYFDPTELNASFEGVAVGRDRLYVANERQEGRILVVNLATLRVVDDFAVAPEGSSPKDARYSDLCWEGDSLWVLLRDARKVLKVDPDRKRVLAEFDYAAMETASATAYGMIYAPGFMEGLMVDGEHLWLLVDNNGFRRRARAGDTRPTLFRCRRPDLAPR